MTLTLVEAREVDPPAGAEPVMWRLLTSHALASFAEAQRITGYYRKPDPVLMLHGLLRLPAMIEGCRLANAVIRTLPAADNETVSETK